MFNFAQKSLQSLLIRFRIKSNFCWVPLAHTCNPSCSGGRDQEDHCLKSAWANSFGDPISKTLITKKKKKKGTGAVAQGVGPEFKPKYQKKKERKLQLLSMVNKVLFFFFCSTEI
jgi:hypothetical protein